MVEQILFAPGGATEAKQDAIKESIEDPINLEEDAIRTFGINALPLSTSIEGPVTDEVLITIGSEDRVRLIRNAGHVDPELANDVFPIVTLKIGSLVIYQDKLEYGLPWSETVAFEGGVNEDLTVSISEAATIYFNIRYQVFT